MRAVLLALLSSVMPLPEAAQLHVTVADAAGAPLADAVIVAVAADPLPEDTEPAPAIENQIDKQFVPYVLVVRQGTLVHFPNQDHIRHQVYSFSPAKRFELPLYSGIEAAPVLFDVPGPVALGCNIHDWMRGYIYVADSPWFAQSDRAGEAHLELPAGTYAVRVWHPRLDGDEAATTRELTFATDDVQRVHWDLRLRADFRLRRAPIGGAGGYR